MPDSIVATTSPIEMMEWIKVVGAVMAGMSPVVAGLIHVIRSQAIMREKLDRAHEELARLLERERPAMERLVRLESKFSGLYESVKQVINQTCQQGG